jgi:hypothetical protein
MMRFITMVEVRRRTPGSVASLWSRSARKTVKIARDDPQQVVGIAE